MVSALETKKIVEEALFGIRSVVGVGLDRETETIKVYVEKATDEVKASIYGRVAGFEVIIVEIGELRPYQAESAAIDEFTYRQVKYDTIFGGISTGHWRVSAGTIGAVVVDDDHGDLCLLSNNHIFANTDTTDDVRANVGDRILQPGSYDGGTLVDTVARLERWIPFDTNGTNYIDAAIAVVDNPDKVDPHILGVGISGITYSLIGIKGIATTKKKIHVRKYGRTTGFTEGMVIDLDFTALGSYDYEEKVLLADQLLIDMWADGGDSGSLIIDDSNFAVGLACLKSITSDGHVYVVANKMHNVAALLGFTMTESDDGEVELPDFPVNGNGGNGTNGNGEPSESLLHPVAVGLLVGGAGIILLSAFMD